MNLDVMLAKRKMRSKELAERIGITEQNVSLLKSGKVRGVRFDTLSKICEVLNCRAICLNTAPKPAPWSPNSNPRRSRAERNPSNRSVRAIQPVRAGAPRGDMS